MPPEAYPELGSTASEDRASSSVLLLRNRLQPLRLEANVDRQVDHGRVRRRPVPVLLSRGDVDRRAGPRLLDRAPLVPKPAPAFRDEQDLHAAVGMPVRP